MEPTTRGRGRPAKPPGEKFRKRVMAWPPPLLAELEARVPERQRAAFIRRAVEKALAAEGRRQSKQQ